MSAHTYNSSCACPDCRAEREWPRPMSAQHTPGPWRTLNRDGRVYEGSGRVVVQPGDSVGPIEAEVNARLIAAAPMLLEAAHRLLLCGDDRCAAEACGDCSHCKLRAAIAAVEGR